MKTQDESLREVDFNMYLKFEELYRKYVVEVLVLAFSEQPREDIEEYVASAIESEDAPLSVTGEERCSDFELYLAHRD